MSTTARVRSGVIDRRCDAIIETYQYLHTEAAKGKKTTLFCAPQMGRGLQSSVSSRLTRLTISGARPSVSDLGRSHRITLWLRKAGLEDSVRTVIVPDKKSGRWGSGVGR